MCVNQLIGKQNHWELSDVSRMQMPTPCRKEKGRLEEGEEGPRCTVIQKTARLVKTYVGQETVEFMGNVGESKKKPVKCWARRNPGKPESTQGKFIVGDLLGRGTVHYLYLWQVVGSRQSGSFPFAARTPLKLIRVREHVKPFHNCICYILWLKFAQIIFCL